MTRHDLLVQKSLEIGRNKTKLKKRLLEAKSVLTNEIKTRFKSAKFNFGKKQLVGDGYTLQWQVRRFPNKPEGYYNQQTNVGIVIVK